MHIARNCFAKPNPTAAVYQEKLEQFMELRDELKEMYVQCDELEYETDEPLEAEETKRVSQGQVSLPLSAERHICHADSRITLQELSHAALDRQRWAAIVTMASDTNGH